MSPDKDKALCEKYPKLFAQRNLPMTQTCMCWGFDCGSGWYQLIDNLCAKITALDPDLEATQIKEKYGGLRVYVGGVKLAVEKEVYKLISEAEDQSYKICEQCGAPGKPNESGWISTLCPKCRGEKK